MQPHDVGEIRDKLGVPHQAGEKIQSVFANDRLRATATAVLHGSIPALVWRIEANGKKIVFSGAANGEGGGLELTAWQADILIAPNAVAEGASGAERNLDMPPAVIGRIADAAGVRQLVLTHRMRRALGRETETLEAIKKRYAGPVFFADDLNCFTP